MTASAVVFHGIALWNAKPHRRRVVHRRQIGALCTGLPFAVIFGLPVGIAHGYEYHVYNGVYDTEPRGMHLRKIVHGTRVGLNMGVMQLALQSILVSLEQDL
jgi:hypothetical protein